MNKPIASLLIAACAALSVLPVAAEKADSNKPMNIEADALRYDDQKQLSTFTGRVVLYKGSIVMRGARLEVRQDPDGHQFGTLTAEPGQRAFFRQKREGVDEYIEGEGEVIEYDGRSDMVRFIRRAEMRRYRGTTLTDSVSGASIVYNNVTEVFSVDGVPSGQGGTTTATGGGRVRAVLAPREAASAPAAAPTPGPRLRSSTGVGESRQ